MPAKEETNKSNGFEFCHFLMGKCSNPGSAEQKAEKFDFKSCEQMMKQCCAAKDRKFDFETFRSKIEQHFQRTNEKTNDKEKN